MRKSSKQTCRRRQEEGWCHNWGPGWQSPPKLNIVIETIIVLLVLSKPSLSSSLSLSIIPINFNMLPTNYQGSVMILRFLSEDHVEINPFVFPLLLLWNKGERRMESEGSHLRSLRSRGRKLWECECREFRSWVEVRSWTPRRQLDWSSAKR